MNSKSAPEAIYGETRALFGQGRLDDARDSCAGGLGRWPNDFSLLYLAGLIELQSGQPERAVEFIGRAIDIKQNNAEAHSRHGDALFDLRRFTAAIESYDRAILLQPDLTAARNNRGLAHWYLRQHGAAIENYDQTLGIDPDNADAYNFRAHALRDLAHHQAAIDNYEAAIALKHDYAEAYNGRGSALVGQRRMQEALASFEQAIALQGNFTEAHVNRGNALRELNRLDEAQISYECALSVSPDFAEAYYRLGDLQCQQGRLEEGLVCYDKAVALKPDMKLLLGIRCHTRMRLCDWRQFDADMIELTSSVARGEPAFPPFVVLALSGSAPEQRRAAQVYIDSEIPPQPLSPAQYRKAPGERIKIGYFSPDFRNHPVSFLTAELFESHDRTSFEVTGVSMGPPMDDPMSRRLKGAFERFVDVQCLTDREVAQMARDLGLDIAVDLCGYTEGGRPGIFAMRAAPIQLSYIGYLGTMASAHIDYLIADKVLIPPECRRHYAEKIIYLPSYQANDSQRRGSQCSRAELGLPPTGFVFCCFNNPYKITPVIFSSWMRILTQVPHSVLFLYAPQARVAANLRLQAIERGVDPGRLIFGGALPRREYLARYQAADLFLDTMPYNAGATASDALWAGLPVLTCAGETLAGRMAASLLTAAQLPELITSTPVRYEALAVNLACDANRMAEIKRRTVEARLASLLFDSRRFTHSLESAYRRIYEKHRSGLPPDDLEVQGSAPPLA